MGEPGPFARAAISTTTPGLGGPLRGAGRANERARIVEGARAVCAAQGLTWWRTTACSEEMAGMAEWPVPLLGDMDPAFLDLPPEVIRTSMRTHQRYFAVRGADGARWRRISSRWPISRRPTAGRSSPPETPECSPPVWKTRDSSGGRIGAIRLVDRLDRLSGVTFHAKLGTMAERAQRIEALAVPLAPLSGRRRRQDGARPRVWPRRTSSPPWSGSFQSCRA